MFVHTYVHIYMCMYMHLYVAHTVESQLSELQLSEHPLERNSPLILLIYVLRNKPFS